jgi:hypothetical protein
VWGSDVVLWPMWGAILPRAGEPASNLVVPFSLPNVLMDKARGRAAVRKANRVRVALGE